MVIQRWQSVLLFIALVLVSIFCVSAYGKFIMPDDVIISVIASTNTGYWLYNMGIVLLLLISIFLFKTPGWQKCLIWISIFMMGGSAIWGYNYLHAIVPQGATVTLGLSWILLCVAFGLAIVSLFLIAADQKLLKSYDRIR